MKEQLLFKTKTRDDYKIVDFSENYNGKLFSPFFTTIRKHYPNEKKYLTGNKLIARYKEGGFQFFCNVVSREVKLLKEIPPIVIITDTGKDYLEGLKLFKDFYGPEALNLPMEVILFKRESGFFYFKEKDLEFQEKISSIISGEKEPDKVINLSSISPEELQQELSWGKEICEEVEEYKKNREGKEDASGT